MICTAAAWKSSVTSAHLAPSKPCYIADVREIAAQTATRAAGGPGLRRAVQWARLRELRGSAGRAGATRPAVKVGRITGVRVSVCFCWINVDPVSLI